MFVRETAHSPTSRFDFEIDVVSLKEGSVKLLVEHGGFAAWAPDGTKIAFARDSGGGKGELYVANADGSGVVRLTHGFREALYPNWSPDGKTIAFVGNEAGDYEIYAISLSSRQLVRLTSAPVDDDSISWSPSQN